jgi:hypothetical protein
LSIIFFYLFDSARVAQLGNTALVASVRRWQCAEVGTLWQLDASSHRWFAENEESFAMLNMLDDCSRVITGARFAAFFEQ